MTPFQIARQEYFRAVDAGKPQSAAKHLLNATITGTAVEVAEFIVKIQQDRGKQDLDLLPNTDWYMDAKGPQGFDNEKGAKKPLITTSHLVELLTGDKTTWRISWPSVVSHWGVAVFFTIHEVEFRAFSADWMITETNRSM
jgi:hypothetical protein